MDAGWEGLGGPVRVDRANLANIDPTLDSCCEREEIAVRTSAHLPATDKLRLRCTLIRRAELHEQFSSYE